MQQSVVESAKKLQALADELARSNEELERFSAVASHDLRSPLNTIVSFVRLIEKRLLRRGDTELLDLLAYVRDGATKMRSLIDDVLAFSRIQKIADSFTATDCNDIVRNVLVNLRYEIETSGAEVTVAPLPTVMGHRMQLTQLFQNLIGNAIKFRGNEPPRICLSVEESDENWTFMVQDNGIGLSSEFAEQIFQPFRRLHPEKVYPGTGLGLAICKSVVERHKGRIWIKSVEGKGSWIYFTVPKQDHRLLGGGGEFPVLMKVCSPSL